MRALTLVVIPILLGVASGTAAKGTPLSLPATPTSESCQTNPVSPDVVAALLATPVPATSTTGGANEGAPADEETLHAVQRVIFEVFACFNAGEPLRAYMHYSDAYLREIFASQSPESLQLLTTSARLDPDEWTAILAIHDIRILADGRAVATVVLDPALIPVQKTFAFILIQSGDHWLIDDVLDELEFSLP